MNDNEESDKQFVNISSLLKEYFDKLGFTQQQIAYKLGISQPAVGALLNGKPFGKKTAHKWGELFNLQPSWLLTGEGEMLRGNPQKTEKESMSDVLIPASVWRIMQKQADSLAARDKQVDELITIIKKQQQEMKKNAAQADGGVIYADAK